MQKTIVCDSGALISLTTSCLTEILYIFKKKYNVSFIIPPAVEEETVLYPMRRRIKEFLFSAVKIKDAINDGVITVMTTERLKQNTERLIKLANNMFYAQGKSINLLHTGETEVLALAGEIGTETILVDERTTRLLLETPFRLKEHMEEEFGVNIMINRNSFEEFSKYVAGLDAIRSSELAMLAYEIGYFNKYQGMEKEAAEAALYKIRFAGCSIRFDEIATYLKLVE
ncbi:MAG: hypothetical protein QW590_00755 [Candidatus Bilamarchaeaceae archaeon]